MRAQVWAAVRTLLRAFEGDLVAEAVVQNDPSPVWVMRQSLRRNTTVWVQPAPESWISPLFDQRGGGLLQYHSQHACRELLRRAENRRGRLYEWVVYTRADLHWLAPHPSLAGRSIPPSGVVWAPWGQTNGGINDRHAALSRNAADTYLGLWEELLGGNRPPSSVQAGEAGVWTAEMVMAWHLRQHNVEVREFTPVAFVECCDSPLTCAREREAAPEKEANRSSDEGRESQEEYGVCAKYFSEWIEATQYTGDPWKVRRLVALGAAWTQLPNGTLVYGCCEEGGPVAGPLAGPLSGIGIHRPECPCSL